MLRLRPYKPCDAQSLVQWLTDEAGYGTQLLTLALPYAFTIMKVEQVSLGVFEHNITAAHCYERLGFQKTGTCTDYHLMGEIWRFHDLTMMKTQWEERQ